MLYALCSMFPYPVSHKLTYGISNLETRISDLIKFTRATINEDQREILKKGPKSSPT